MTESLSSEPVFENADTLRQKLGEIDEALYTLNASTSKEEHDYLVKELLPRLQVLLNRQLDPSFIDQEFLETKKEEFEEKLRELNLE